MAPIPRVHSHHIQWYPAHTPRSPISVNKVSHSNGVLLEVAIHFV